MDKIPECELGNTIDKHEGNRKILSKFGYDALKVCERRITLKQLLYRGDHSKWPEIHYFVQSDQLWTPFSLTNNLNQWYTDCGFLISAGSAVWMVLRGNKSLC